MNKASTNNADDARKTIEANADKAKAPPTDSRKKLRGISEIRSFFYQNDRPIYFVSATCFNLLGMDDWVRKFKFINYIDCFDGMHPSVFVPEGLPGREFSSIEEINNYLLAHPEVKAFVEKNGTGQAAFLFFDEESERLCEKLGLEIAFPPAALRETVDSKIVTTQIGDDAGVPSVPNAMARVGSWDELRALARANELGDELVIQTAFGDSGHTTFFVANEGEYNEYKKEIEAESEVKVMRRIRCRGAALEACVTKAGTLVGPLMTELVGFRELTPYKGGWCGNEVFAGAFSPKVREYARQATLKLGAQLEKRGYRGYFEVDYLLDLDRDEVYLGEMNPRITGASSMTNLAAFAHADAPLFLFHLLEWSGVDFEFDVSELNARWECFDNIDSWSQMVIKATGEDVERITAAPSSGVWELSETNAAFVRPQIHRRTVQMPNRAFFFRIAKRGDYFYEGADLGILVMPGRAMDDDFQLTLPAKRWIEAIRAQYTTVNAKPEEVHVHPGAKSGGFKLM